MVRRQVARAIQAGEYRIGTAKDGHTIFYQFDTQDRYRGGKIIPYNPETGHRIKDDHFQSGNVGPHQSQGYALVSTGGKSQFNDRLMVLNSWKVTAFPDIGGYDKCRKKAKNYAMLDIIISDILERNATLEQRERQVNIADALLEEIKRSDLNNAINLINVYKLMIIAVN